MVQFSSKLFPRCVTSTILAHTILPFPTYRFCSRTVYNAQDEKKEISWLAQGHKGSSSCSGSWPQEEAAEPPMKQFTLQLPHSNLCLNLKICTFNALEIPRGCVFTSALALKKLNDCLLKASGAWEIYWLVLLKTNPLKWIKNEYLLESSSANHLFHYWWIYQTWPDSEMVLSPKES